MKMGVLVVLFLSGTTIRAERQAPNHPGRVSYGRVVRSWIAAVLVGVLSCAAPGAQVSREQSESRYLENLRRAAQYPWVDEGSCAVREAAGEWRTLVERCYFALDLSRIQFQDIEHRCPVAQADVATVETVVGMCLLVQPELVVGAIIVIGVVVVASAIAAELAKEQAIARVPVAAKPCWCTCLGKVDPDWNPRDPKHGNRFAEWQPHPAECRTECINRGFRDSQCP